MTERRKYPRLRVRTPELALIMDLWIELQERARPEDPDVEDLRENVERMLAGVPKCDDPHCKGWFTNEETGRVERCDSCARYPHDEAAARAARRGGWVE